MLALTCSLSTLYCILDCYSIQSGTFENAIENRLKETERARERETETERRTHMKEQKDESDFQVVQIDPLNWLTNCCRSI